MESGIVFDIRRYAVHDGPGIRTTVFLKGCPLSCWWCHNPESQSMKPELMLQPKLCIHCGLCDTVREKHSCAASFGEAPPVHRVCMHAVSCANLCPTGARLRLGNPMTVAEVMRSVVRDRPFYDQSGGGVTFSGGEPFAQPEFLLELLRQCSREEIHVAVDTSGYTDASWIRAAAKYNALFLYDVKIIDSDKHAYYTGVPSELILANLQLLAELRAQVIVRVPVIPGVSDSNANIDALGKWLASLAMRWPVQLLAYHNLPEGKYAALHRPYAMEGLEAPSTEHMQFIENRLRGFGLLASISG